MEQRPLRITRRGYAVIAAALVLNSALVNYLLRDWTFYPMGL